VTKKLNAERAEKRREEKRREEKADPSLRPAKGAASVRDDNVWGWRKKIRENGKAGHFVRDGSG
jgi:hypothetical protein